jgi:apolipoprotein N-acyltransferase
MTGVLYPLCFPSFDLGWLAWVVLVPLHLAIEGLPPRRAFWWGWLAGAIAFVGVMSWVITAMTLYGQVPWVVSTLLMLLLATYLGAYIGLYTLGVAWGQQSWPIIMVFGGPCLWVALELLRTHFLSGLPWALLGYTQYQWLTVIQFADITGVYGVSFLIVLGNSALASLILWSLKQQRSPSIPFPWSTLFTMVTTLALVLLYGIWQLHTQSKTDSQAPQLTIGLVQANIDQAHKWDEAYRQQTLHRYADLSKQAAQNVDLLIWPEAATPFLFEREPAYQGEVLQIARDAQSPLLFGSPALRHERYGTPYLLNSAYLLTPSGKVAGRYDKRHLVPFGEYIPLRTLLFFLDKLVVGIGDFKTGTGPLTLTLQNDTSNLTPRFGVAICFEVIFPDEVRQRVKEGADFLVTITNDAWFGESVAPYQHFGMVVFRAVENRTAFARAANTGISGFIAPDGHILAATPIFTQEALTGTIPFRRTTTFYTTFGDVFAWACVIIATLWIWMAKRRIAKR